MHEHTVQVYCYGTFRLEVTLYTMVTSQVFMCKQRIVLNGEMVTGAIRCCGKLRGFQEYRWGKSLTDCSIPLRGQIKAPRCGIRI